MPLKLFLYIDPVQKVTLASSNKNESLKYWSDLLGFKVYDVSDSQALLGYAEEQAKLQLKFIGMYYSCSKHVPYAY